MSWSSSGTIEDAGGLDELAFTPQQGHGSTESAEAFDVAKAIATNLIASGVVGPGPYRVSLAGHANPGHRLAEGWAPDGVTVTVTSAERAE